MTNGPKARERWVVWSVGDSENSRIANGEGREQSDQPPIANWPMNRAVQVEPVSFVRGSRERVA